MQRWYVIMTKPSQDEVAEQNLKNQNYEVYRPTMVQQKKRRGKSVTVVESLFPRYLFIKLDDQNQNWGPIRSTKGVVQLVKFGHKLAEISPLIIEAIQQREAALLNQPVENTLKQGDALRVESGPFYGLQGVFEKYDADQRIIALMDILGQSQKITFDANQVQKQS
jgi:transcriptional antiterminator RfaH